LRAATTAWAASSTLRDCKTKKIWYSSSTGLQTSVCVVGCGFFMAVLGSSN